MAYLALSAGGAPMAPPPTASALSSSLAAVSPWSCGHHDRDDDHDVITMGTTIIIAELALTIPEATTPMATR